METYIKVKLTADLSGLSVNEKKMIPIFIEIAKIMDGIFWQEAYGNKEEFLSSFSNKDYKQYGLINYGPWDRLDGNKSFVIRIGPKPAGANFYPIDMTKEEFEASAIAKDDQQYNLVRRDENGQLINIPYHVAFKEEITKA